MRIPAEQKDWLTREIAAVIDQLPPNQSRHLYSELLTAVDAGEVPEDLQEPLARLLAVGLESGRIRRLYGAHAEMAASRLYARSPDGEAAGAALARVNEALCEFAGATLNRIAFDSRFPGSYTLTLDTARGQLTLTIDRQGVRLHAAEVAG
ncbi:MAG: hypothetical protein HY320_15030 [Armatimonadetes bacterium]|nr:hypothetical protein [Armatimonadota bacterium]